MGPRLKVMNRKMRLAGVLLCSTAVSMPALAMGKKQAPPSGGSCVPGNDSGLVTPNPVRKVVLKPVTTKAFTLPNGARVDLSTDLDLLINTAVAGTSAFSPTDPSGGGAEDCNGHIEIRAGVSNLVLDAFELGISFGYTPSGEKGVVTGVQGSAKVKVGTVAMDFSVWNCVAGSCSAVAASTASALTAGVTLSAEIDFGAIKTGPDLVYNTPIGDALRKIMVDGVKKLASSDRLAELPWSARVRESVPGAGTLVFDAGLRSRLQLNQSFVVYAATPASGGACDVYKAVAHVHTTQVEPVSSLAVVDESLDSRGIQDGDVVMIRPRTQAASRAPASSLVRR